MLNDEFRQKCKKMTAKTSNHYYHMSLIAIADIII